jgi:DNA-binding MarR family transcriptional regulator
MSELFFHRWVDVLRFIYSKTDYPDLRITDISFGLKIPISTVVNRTRDLESAGLITSRVTSHNRFVRLTPNGLLVVNHLNSIDNIIPKK